MPTSFPDGELDSAAELGAIDDHSVRVWVRKPGSRSVSGTLLAGTASLSATAPLTADTDWTGVLRFDLPDPAPDTPFTITIGEQELTGRLTPTAGTPTRLSFGFGSCHQPFLVDAGKARVSDHASGLYPAMQRELSEAQARLLLLIGDQIYADEDPGISVRDDLTDDPEQPPSFTAALAAYRRNYRGFFNQSGMRALRETFPTLMMWDDHDILDNWGSTKQRDPLDECLFSAATQAYREYQHPRNPDTGKSDPPFDWITQHGNIGILALDLRGARDPEHGTMLGDDQWQRVSAHLSGTESQDIQTLFVIASVPIAHVARWFTTVFDVLPERLASSVKDRWSVRRFINSRDALLDALFAWQSAEPKRQVILLSGDVHCASAFTIRQRNGTGVIQQVTSSALSTPLIKKQQIFNRIVVRGHDLLEPRYRFERRFLSVTHNFGIVRCEPLEAGGHRVAITIRGWQPQRRTTRTVGRLVTVP